ncbi:MAG: aspartate carbamoyltransferase regulatory subunit [Candidatus Micrarchaeota archaeon]|nr:aspartate carbamoyltransferase regulatory subunit [Candidatus Micrarchaeota archaeon]
MDDTIMINKIKEGTVIDHIPVRKAMLIPRILGLADGKDTIAILVNAKSRLMGFKDIVKIENRILKDDEVNMLSLIAPGATINLIKDYKIAGKKSAVIPKMIEGLLKCPNGHCITNHDPEARTVFDLVAKEPLEMRCGYCDIALGEQEALKQVSGE